MLVLCLLVLSSGCGKKADEAQHQKPSGFPSPLDLANPSDSSPAASEVLVEVNGDKLIRREADKQVEMSLAEMNNRRPIPPQFQAQAELQTFKKVIDQFIAVSLLKQEADRQQVVASEGEIAEAFKSIAARLPPGRTLDDIMNRSPFGKDRMRQDVITGLRVNKMLEPAASNLPPVTEQEVGDFYGNMRRARHVLIKTDSQDDPQAKETKKQKAEELRKRLAEGADFAEIARANSDCPSKQKGGELGVFPRGQMDPTFEKVAFSLNTNELSQVVETQFGYHIIQALPLGKGTSDVPDEDKAKRYLKGKKMETMLTAYVAKLKSTATIKFSPSLPPAITGETTSAASVPMGMPPPPAPPSNTNG
jgi:peptidyl-prolyl cis-trans isomerase C